MREERGNWYLLTGFAIGIILGLVFAWVVYPWFAPQEYNDNSPASLQSEFKDQYRSMIALAYVATGNLPRAEARLALLGDSDIVRALAEQAQQTLAEGESTSEAQALGAQDAVPDPGSTEQPPSASENSETGPSPTASDQTPQVTRTTNSTVTPLPTRTPTATPGSPFVLQENTFVCETTISGPLIQVIAENTNGRALSGQEIVVSWQEGEDRFFSGLKPELGQGYADFLMIPGVVYQVRMSAGGQTVPDITPAECETQGGRRYWGSWLLVFSRP
jgi:hypothetical protein